MKKFFFTLLIILIATPFLIFAEYDNTISYLQNQTQNTWITQALVSAQAENIDISYLDNNTDDLMTASKNILALTAIQSDDYETLNNLLGVINNNFIDNQLGSSELLNDDFWGLLALSSLHSEDNISSIKEFILSNQNEDGGWSWSVTGQSDSNDTAAAILALLETDLTISSSEIVLALDYLHTVQNEDGGFGYDTNSESDGASTAWIISMFNKANIDINDWYVGDNNPILFLQSLQLEDGSFTWLTGDEDGSSMVTSYALLSLSNGTYPLNYIDLSVNNTVNVDLRIEGPDNTICLASLEASNVLELLISGSEVCNFDYIVQDTEYGPYVSSIDYIDAEGMSGWQYWVNSASGMVAVDEYILEVGDEVLWAYGEYGIQPTRVETNQNIFLTGEDITITITYFDGSDWLVLENIEVYVNNDIYITDENGQVNLTINEDGIYTVYSEQTESYIRSNKEYITIGNGISEIVDLSVNILNDNPENEDSVSFTINQSMIDFGDLEAGQSAENILSLTNTGTVDIYIEASIIGDNIFDFTNLNQSEWSNFNLIINPSDSEAVNVELSIPSNTTDSGQQNGQLIFWATIN